MNKLNMMQKKAVNLAKKALLRHSKALFHMATGTGKTETAIKTIKEIGYKRVLWLTHQDELAHQTFERLINNGITDVSLFNGEFKDTSGSIVIATIQTISRPNHLNCFNKNEFDAIFVDEAHHSPAETWIRTIEYFKADKIGLTATPLRPDNLHNKTFDMFGEAVYKLDFNSAVKRGFLAKPISTIVLTNSSIEGFISINKDFTEKQLDKLYTSNDRNSIIIEEYKSTRKKVRSPKAVCFCINIQHAVRMSEMFNNNNIKSAFICGDSYYQTHKDRESVMDKFRTTNEIEVVCAVNIFNEGVDIPEANIALMARPTCSNIVYQQQVGRIARTNNGKKKTFHVLDFVDNTGKEYRGYVMSNIAKGGSVHTRVIVKYLNDKDPVAIKKRVNDIMSRVNKFESELLNEYRKIKDITVKALAHYIKTGEVDESVYE